MYVQFPDIVTEVAQILLVDEYSIDLGECNLQDLEILFTRKKGKTLGLSGKAMLVVASVPSPADPDKAVRACVEKLRKYGKVVVSAVFLLSPSEVCELDNVVCIGNAVIVVV